MGPGEFQGKDRKAVLVTVRRSLFHPYALGTDIRPPDLNQTFGSGGFVLCGRREMSVRDDLM